MQIHFETARMRALSVLIVAGMLAGCGGGASTKPTVKVKPAEKTTPATVAQQDKVENGQAPAAGGIGVLSGRVLFEGAPPALGPIIEKGKASKDPQVCAATDNVPNETLVVASDGGLKNVYIYLEEAPAGTTLPPVPKEPVVFDQKNCVFLTHASFVRTGQTILIKSDDAVAHNTHPFPKRQQADNITLGAANRDGVPLVYSRAERTPFPVKCDIHPWMIAYQFVLEHPYCAVTQEDGSFEIPGLPAGNHEFRIWHESAADAQGFLDKAYKVTVTADETTKVDIPFARAKFK